MSDIKHTPLYNCHRNLGAKIIEFAGYKMPFSYVSPTQEHLNVRKHGGVFDISHMGELRVIGKDSLVFLQQLLPTDIASLKSGQAKYSVLCNKEGGLIDDLIVYAIRKK